MAMFDENIVRFETAFDTPLRLALEGIDLHEWLEKAEVVVEDYRQYVKTNNVQFCRKTWETYKKTANWQELTEKCLKPKVERKNFFMNLFS